MPKKKTTEGRKMPRKSNAAAAVPEMSPAEMLAMAARLMEQAAKATQAATQTPAPRVAIEQPAQPAVDWSREVRTCPKCGHKGKVSSDFGTKTIRGKESPQSWCRSCRSSTNYHARPRQYKTGR